MMDKFPRQPTASLTLCYFACCVLTHTSAKSILSTYVKIKQTPPESETLIRLSQLPRGKVPVFAIAKT